MFKNKTNMAKVAAGLGILLIIAGTMRGEVSTVLNTSIRICLECIGIG